MNAPQTWAVGMTSALRPPANGEQPQDVLRDSVASVIRAGWGHVHIFAEPDLPDVTVDDATILRNDERLYPWLNFCNALASLVWHEPRADAYLVFQDDVRVSAHARDYLERDACPDTTGVASLYTCRTAHDPNTTGWHSPLAAPYGALGFLFSQFCAKLFVLTADLDSQYRNKIDMQILWWTKARGLDFWTHSPSLIRHTGRESVIGGARLTGSGGNRQCAEFCEDADDLVSRSDDGAAA